MQNISDEALFFFQMLFLLIIFIRALLKKTKISRIVFVLLLYAALFVAAPALFLKKQQKFLLSEDIQLRAAPSEIYNKSTFLSAGSFFFLLKEKGNWVQLSSQKEDNCITGWIKKNELLKNSNIHF